MKQFYKNLIQGKRLALLMSVIVFCTIVILVFVVQHSENNEVYENSPRPEPILNEDVSPNKNIEKDSVKNIEKNVVHFCIDVNPGVEFTLDENGIVTDVRAANEDAEKLLLGLDLIGKSGDTATVELLNRLEEQNYITPKTKGRIILLSVGGDTSNAADLTLRINQSMSDELGRRNLVANVVVQDVYHVDEIQQMAEKLGISFGKMQYLINLVGLNSDIPLEEIKDYPLDMLVKIKNDLDELNSSGSVKSCQSSKDVPWWQRGYRDENGLFHFYKSEDSLGQLSWEVLDTHTQESMLAVGYTQQDIENYMKPAYTVYMDGKELYPYVVGKPYDQAADYIRKKGFPVQLIWQDVNFPSGANFEYFITNPKQGTVYYYFPYGGMMDNRVPVSVYVQPYRFTHMIGKSEAEVIEYFSKYPVTLEVSHEDWRRFDPDCTLVKDGYCASIGCGPNDEFYPNSVVHITIQKTEKPQAKPTEKPEPTATAMPQPTPTQTPEPSSLPSVEPPSPTPTQLPEKSFEQPSRSEQTVE